MRCEVSELPRSSGDEVATGLAERPLELGEEAGERGPLVRREGADQVRLVREEPADRGLDQGVAGLGEPDGDGPAGGGRRRPLHQPGQDADLEDVAAAWRANLDANLISAVLTTTAVLPGLRPGGTIINVGSIGAEYASTSYGAAKAALAAWTAGLSADVGPRGLTANVISPGYTAGTGFFRGRLTEQREARLIGATHDGRAGRPEDVAETAYFLASDGARHITGQNLHVNGGAHTTR